MVNEPSTQATGTEQRPHVESVLLILAGQVVAEKTCNARHGPGPLEKALERH